MKRWILILVIIFVLVVFSVWMRAQLRIDSCLDNGGRWNSIQEVCDMASSEPVNMPTQ